MITRSPLLLRLCRALLLLFVGFSGGCEREPSALPVPDAQGTPGHRVVVGTVGDITVGLGEVEAPVRLALFELELQRYRLRRASLERLVLRRLDRDGSPAPRAVLRLQPPLPPRLALGGDGLRVRPADDAPITVLSFCNFESPHCARLQLQLDQLRSLYGESLAFVNRDLFLPFRRHAAGAAEAAHCAREQGAYWRFHDLLYADRGTPDRERLERVARAAQLDLKRYRSCLQSGRYRSAVAADIALASQHRLETVPAVFINGLYAGREPRTEQLLWLIEHELARLNLISPRHRAAERISGEALRLRALLPSVYSGQGVALLAPTDSPDAVGTYREGDRVGSHLILRRITVDRVEFINGGSVEWLGFGHRAVAKPAAVQNSTASDGPVAATPEQRWPHRAVPVTLDRTEVLVRLAERPALERLLQPVPMQVEGYHLLRITTVPRGSLYELLGLREGDAVVMVNEAPLHEGENPLWHALQSEDEVRLRVIGRGGLARHLTFRFND